MIPALSLCAAATALLAIAADGSDRGRRRHRAFYALKPLTTALIVAIAMAGATATPSYRELIVAALLLSLAGDVCLMFDGDRAFVGGLASFLLAHLAFAAAFLQGIPAPEPPGWLAAVLFYAAGMLYVLLPRAGRMRIPVLLYCTVIAAMVFAAAVRHEALRDRDSLLALLGALFFLGSDSVLGWRRFVGRFRHAQAAILSTYWTAIGLIAASV